MNEEYTNSPNVFSSHILSNCCCRNAPRAFIRYLVDVGMKPAASSLKFLSLPPAAATRISFPPLPLP